MEDIGAGHIIWQSGSVFWCARCAYHTVSRVEGLRRPCKGVATKGSALRRKRLLQGRHPATGGAILERPIKIGTSKGVAQGCGEDDAAARVHGNQAEVRANEGSWVSRLEGSLQRFGLALADLDVTESGDDGDG